MKIVIDAEAKEIAELLLALEARQEEKVDVEKVAKELVRRLAALPGVEIGQAGPYQKFEVKRKYSNDRTEITDAAVIVIPHLVF